jgi:hypothetical protein
MKQLDLDIFVFPKIINDELIERLMSIRHNSGFDGRIDLHVEDKNTFYIFESLQNRPHERSNFSTLCNHLATALYEYALGVPD